MSTAHSALRYGAALADYTTLRVGGPAARLIEAATPEQIHAAVAEADAEGAPLLVLGGGSNLVVADTGFGGTVLRIATRGIGTEPAGDRTLVRVQAGEDWDSFVAWTVAQRLSGVECLSGIPGRVGATPIQNVGAYGQDVSETVTEVVVWDRDTGERRRLDNAACGFTYRNSVFKATARFVVCEVAFALTPSALSAPVRYAELARGLGVDIGDRAPLARVREAVLGLRRGKGMVLDPADPDTRSAGSFFTNPVLTADGFAALRRKVAERLGPEAEPPAFPQPGGGVKTSAAWLIERAGFPKGYGSGPARISTKHTLALTNAAGASATQLLDLAREVRDGVAAAFDVELVAEPVLVGAKL